jgi:hypothetical protein
VANYPLDGYPDHSQKLTGERNPAPDDKAFQYFAKLYAKKHAFMSKSKVSNSSRSWGQSQHKSTTGFAHQAVDAHPPYKPPAKQH